MPDRAVMRTVTAAFTAARDGRFDELGLMLADGIDWRGLPDEDGELPRCQGRRAALARMRVGLLAEGHVEIGELVEQGDRVLACVHRVVADDVSAGENLRPSDWFVVAEVRGGQIAGLRAYATEREARDVLAVGFQPLP